MVLLIGNQEAEATEPIPVVAAELRPSSWSLESVKRSDCDHECSTWKVLMMEESKGDEADCGVTSICNLPSRVLFSRVWVRS